MTMYQVDTGRLGGVAGEAESDAAVAESLRAVAQGVRTIALAAGSERVAQAGLALAARMAARVEATNAAALLVAGALRVSHEAYREVEQRVDALFVPRWVR